jgi:hypothetical protein
MDIYIPLLCSESDVFGLVTVMCLVDKVVHIVKGLNPVYTFVNVFLCCYQCGLLPVFPIWHMLCFPCR